MSKVGEGFLYAHQVAGSVAALARGFLPLSEVSLCLDEMSLEGCQVFVVLVPPGPAVFWVFYCLGHQSVCNTE